MSTCERVVQPCPTGWIEKLIIYGLLLIVVFTFFLCVPEYFQGHPDHEPELNKPISQANTPGNVADVILTFTPADISNP